MPLLTMQHRYLFILEVEPVKTEMPYGELPSHLTLMSRFFSELSPGQLAEIVHPLFERTAPVQLIFEATGTLGPKKLTVHGVKNSDELKQLHNDLHTILDAAGVEYEYPAFTGKGHKPHVTQRPGIRFLPGDTKTTRYACLVEVIDGKRIVRSRFRLSGKRQA